LRRVLEDTLHAELRKQPWRLHQMLGTVADGTALDEEWSLVDLDLLVVSLRDLRSADIHFAMAAPR
jgi:hypothetical protein